MECVSTWPLLQRNKIEDSKINIAVQAIADTAATGGETTVIEVPVKSEEVPLLQDVKAEPSESTSRDSAQPDGDQPQSVVKSENAEPADVPLLGDSINDMTQMVVDEPNPEPERCRTSERYESQATKLKRLATKVSTQ